MVPDPPALAQVDLDAEAELPRDELDAEHPAFIVYTSGTTGLPKGAILPRRSVTSNLDALAEAWEWTADDRLTHGLPLFHVHGLVVGLLGPLRRGGALRHLGRFDPDALTGALEDGATMVFGVPTMYHRLAEEAAGNAAPRRRARPSAAAGVRLGAAACARLRARARADRPADRRALRPDRDADEHGRARERRAATRLRRRAARRRRSCGWSPTTAATSRSRTTRRSARSPSAGRTSSRAT